MESALFLIAAVASRYSRLTGVWQNQWLWEHKFTIHRERWRCTKAAERQTKRKRK